MSYGQGAPVRERQFDMRLPPGYRIREGTADDTPALLRHRIRMFEEMGLAIDREALGAAFASWIAVQLPNGTYRAWLVEDERGAVVAGGGITLLPWPPGPHELSGTLPIVYNVYTETAHRRRGLARAVMETIHAWCRDRGYRVVGLAASDDGRPLYESLGYRQSWQPYMFLAL
jgi:GNAT superfamily N-acetyltransferase